MVDFIENDSTLLRDVLKRHLSESSEALFALAFIRQSGVNMIFSDLVNLIHRGGKVSILFANDFGATQAEAIRTLGEIGVQLRFFSRPNASFHVKAYLLKKADSGIAIIGSSNLSASGLTTGTEWNVSIKSSEIEFGRLLSEYTKLWQSEHSKQVTDDLLNQFESQTAFQQAHAAILEEDRYPVFSPILDTRAVINDSRNYVVRRKPHKEQNSFFQIYTDELKRKSRNGEFNVVVVCNYQAPNQLVFSIPYSYLKENILGFAHLESNDRYLFNVHKKTHWFTWNRGIKMEGGKFLLK